MIEVKLGMTVYYRGKAWRVRGWYPCGLIIIARDDIELVKDVKILKNLDGCALDFTRHYEEA